MAEPKPLVFGQKAPAAQKAPEPSALAFPTTSPPQAKNTPAPTPGVVQFSATPVVSKASPAPTAAAKPMIAADPRTRHIVDRFKTTHPGLYAQNELSIIRQIDQLIPLSVEVVVEWGRKTLERQAQASVRTNQLIQELSAWNVTDTIDRMMQVIAPQSGGGLFSKLRSKGINLATCEATLQAARDHFGGWMKRCDDQQSLNDKSAHEVAAKIAVLSVVIDVQGTNTDISLDQAVTNRRNILAQAATQAQMTAQLLSQIKQQVIDQRQLIDQMLDVTLPAHRRATVAR